MEVGSVNGSAKASVAPRPDAGVSRGAEMPMATRSLSQANALCRTNPGAHRNRGTFVKPRALCKAPEESS